MGESKQALLAIQGYIELGMTRDAWAEWEALPEEEQADLDVLGMFLEAFIQLEKWQLVSDIAKTLAVQFREKEDLWVTWAFALLQQKLVDEAKSVLMEAMSIDPHRPLIQYNLACCECLLGNLTSARSLIDMCCMLEPSLRKRALNEPALATLFGKLES